MEDRLRRVFEKAGGSEIFYLEVLNQEMEDPDIFAITYDCRAVHLPFPASKKFAEEVETLLSAWISAMVFGFFRTEKDIAQLYTALGTDNLHAPIHLKVSEFTAIQVQFRAAYAKKDAESMHLNAVRGYVALYLYHNLEYGIGGRVLPGMYEFLGYPATKAAGAPKRARDCSDGDGESIAKRPAVDPRNSIRAYLESVNYSAKAVAAKFLDDDCEKLEAACIGLDDLLVTYNDMNRLGMYQYLTGTFKLSIHGAARITRDMQNRFRGECADAGQHF